MSGRDAAHLTAFLHSLERTDRLVLMLHYAEALTAEEIGLVLDLPENLVDGRIEGLRRRAAAFLQKNLFRQPGKVPAGQL